MKTRPFLPLLFSVLLLLLSCLPASADFQKSKIAVLDFELIGDKLDTQGMGAILSEWFITAIVKSGRFDVVERAMLQKIISEQKLATTGIIDENSASELGKILGVKVIISGSVLKIGNQVEINSRVISVESGSIIAAENIRGSSDSDLHGLVDALTTKIMRNFPLTGYIVKKDGTSAVIDLGLESGLTVGTEFVVWREGEVIKHPKTGEVLDVEQIITGQIKITQVSKNVAFGQVIKEEGDGIAYGNQVTSVQKLVEQRQPQPPVSPPPVVQNEPQPAPVPAEKKTIAAVRPVKHQQPPEASSQVPVSTPPPTPVKPAKKDLYRIALLPWLLEYEAGSMRTVLTDRIAYQINEIPKARLTKSAYYNKGAETFDDPGSASSYFSMITPNISLIQQRGRALDVDYAIVGRMDVRCRWADNCIVKGINFCIVDIETGKLIQRRAQDTMANDARDFISRIARESMEEFARTID